MNKMFLCMAFLTIAVIAFAQPPQAFKYQTIVRDASGELIQNQNVSLRFSIRDGSVSGTILYREIHNIQTSALGLVNIEIGNGILISGSMSNIDWASDIKFLQTELDITGGSLYITMGTSELLSVPYALYAESTGDQIWSKDGSTVYYNTGNVGIGTDTPGAQLDVQGHIWQSGTGNSVFLGEDAGRDDDLSNNNNTNIGVYAGRNNVSGSNNVAIGYNAGSGNEFGSNNIIIGANAYAISNGSSDRLNIGNTIFANLSNKQVGIGTNSPIVDLDIRDNDGVASISLSSNYSSSRFALDKENETDAAYVSFNTNSSLQWALGTIGNNGLSISREWSSPDGTMYFNGDGNVGINTLTPGAKLDVAGHIWQSGIGSSVFIGINAGANDDLNYNQNTFIGASAGYENTSGGLNTAIGGLALSSNLEANYNTAVGHSSLRYNVSGNSNTALGYASLSNNDIGNYNTASGYLSLYSNISGYYNTAVGYLALQNNETSFSNTAIGHSALINCTGGYNTAIGNYSGQNLTTGSFNILMGCNVPDPEGNNQMYLGGVLYGDLSNGNIGIGTTNPIANLHLYDDLHTTLRLQNTSSGTGTTDGSVISHSDNNSLLILNYEEGDINLSAGSYATTEMTIKNNGRVGIGTEDPGAKLDVAGHIWQTGTGNSVFIGQYAGANDDLSSNNNTFVGYKTGTTNGSGEYNSAFGYKALYSNSTGKQNTAVGMYSLYLNESGYSNTAIGYGSLSEIETGDNNTAMGINSLTNCTGNSNIAIGAFAGNDVTTGSSNILIGCDAPVPTGSYQMYLGGILYGDRLNARIGIGTTNPSAGLHIKGSGFPNSFLYIEGGANQDAGIRLYEGSNDKWHIFNNETANGLQIYNTVGQTVFFAKQSNGNVGIGTTVPSQRLTVYNGSTTGTYTTSGWQHSSDARLKTNISQIDGALEKVMEMEGVYFDWKDKDEKHQVGLIAQDVEKVLPEVVAQDDDGYYSVSYGGVVPVLIEAIKEMKAENEELKKRIEQLEKK